MEQTSYIHGTEPAEQARLRLLNELTNKSFIDFLQIEETSSVLEVGSGLGILAQDVARLVLKGEVVGVEYSREQMVPLLQQAGFDDITLSIQLDIHYTARSSIHICIENQIVNIESAAKELQLQQLATEEDINLVTVELTSWLERDDPCAFFSWN